ncbi:tripartite motif-containing protein 3-like [Argonauta hians]
MSDDVKTNIMAHITCPICLEILNRPLTLTPCLHSYCTECLRSYVSNSNFTNSNGIFPCPECRNEIQLPPGGIDGFSHNHTLQNIIEQLSLRKGQDGGNIDPSPTQPPPPQQQPPQLPPRTVPVPVIPAGPVAETGTNEDVDISTFTIVNTSDVEDNSAQTEHPTDSHTGTSDQTLKFSEQMTSSTETPSEPNFGTLPPPPNYPPPPPPNQLPNQPLPPNQLPNQPPPVNNAQLPPLPQLPHVLPLPHMPQMPHLPQMSNPPYVAPHRHNLYPNINDSCNSQQFGGTFPQIPQIPLTPFNPVTPVAPIAPPEFCTEGMLLKFGRYSSSVNEFRKPYGLDVSREGKICVTDLRGGRILIFSKTGVFLQKIVPACEIFDIAISRGLQQRIITAVSKTEKSIMHCYDFAGNLNYQYTGLHFQYARPSGVAVNKEGYAIVTSLENNCVYIFTEVGKLSKTFGWKGAGNEHFDKPYFVTTNDKRHIIVSDSGNHCIKVFSNEGKFKYKIGKEGKNPGMLFKPMGVCTDRDNNIIVADFGNYRVQAFSPKGEFRGFPVKDTFRIGPDISPVNVAMDPSNNIVVLLIGNQFAEVRVYEWNPAPI